MELYNGSTEIPLIFDFNAGQGSCFLVVVVVFSLVYGVGTEKQLNVLLFLPPKVMEAIRVVLDSLLCTTMSR